MSILRCCGGKVRCRCYLKKSACFCKCCGCNKKGIQIITDGRKS